MATDLLVEDDPKDPSFGLLIAHYEFKEEVGRGAWGVVHKAFSHRHRADVAIKVIPRNILSSKSLDREILTLRVASDHPSIIRLLDVLFTAKNAYLVTELAHETLHEKLTEHGQFSEKEASVMLHQILLGVAHMHDNGIAHRDLKLKNVLLMGDDIPDIKIADFGLSRFFSANGLMETACGSPEFVAPEILSTRPYDKACDMWSIGVMAYTLLTGCFPFWSSRLTAQYRKIMAGVYSWPKSCFISETARDFVRRLLETDPTIRMTAVEAITHPWIAWQASPPSKIFKNWRDNRELYEMGINSVP